MATPSPWRQRLLCSLTGQLQLATYIAVFFGFSGASVASLWLNQRTLGLSTEEQLRANAKALESHLLADRLLEIRPNESAAARTARKQAIRQELRWHSTRRETFWIEEPNGQLLLPFNTHLGLNVSMAEAVTKAGGKAGVTQTLNVTGTDYIVINNRIYPSGQRVWSSADITHINKLQSTFLNWMVVVWGGCLVLSIWTVNGLVGRIILPLRQLTQASAQLTADTLDTSALQIQQAPLEVIQLANTYNALRSRLAKSWADQRQFVSAVSHELRTPLTIVQGYLQRTLKRGTNLNDAQRRGLTTAEEESVRMRHLLDDLLDLSRSDSGQLRLNNKPVALDIAVDEVVNLARSSLEREIHVDIPNPENAPSLVAMADQDRLRQVLLDLIENAHKYSPEGRPVTVRLRRDDNTAVVEVEDQGIGIPEKDLPKVFERFHRAANASVSSGSGLGLSIVELLVEAMGGEVTVRSALDQGSTFTVRLPFATVEEMVTTTTET